MTPDDWSGPLPGSSRSGFIGEPQTLLHYEMDPIHSILKLLLPERHS